LAELVLKNNRLFELPDALMQRLKPELALDISKNYFGEHALTAIKAKVPSTKHENQYAKTGYAFPPDGVALHAAPDPSSAEQARVPSGERVDLLWKESRTSPWHKAVWKGKVGWVQSELVPKDRVSGLREIINHYYKVEFLNGYDNCIDDPQRIKGIRFDLDPPRLIIVGKTTIPILASRPTRKPKGFEIVVDVGDGKLAKVTVITRWRGTYASLRVIGLPGARSEEYYVPVGEPGVKPRCKRR
jgi:hypothetical protein